MRSPRWSLVLPAAALAAVLALPALPALAQSNSGGGSEFPDLVPVAIWTLVAIVIALLAVSIGYLYRREQGMDRPLHPPPVDAFGVMERHDESRDTAGQPLPEHVVAAHAEGQHDDATEQARLLHERGGQ